ncbi:YraN family protein [Spirochaeta dissipatitropha]
MKKGRANIQGSWGESAAAEYLMANQHKILEKNYKRTGGEVDIISMEGDCLVFTEVKTWTSLPPEELSRVISRSKRQHILRTAELFLLEHPEYRERSIRFDIILLSGKHGLRHYANAFQGADEAW